jgi:hypothetical protein
MVPGAALAAADRSDTVSVMSDLGPALQMRLDFGDAVPAGSVVLTLVGMTVAVECLDGRTDQVRRALRRAGCNVEVYRGELRFPAHQIACLARLPGGVNLAPDDALRPLLLVTLYPPAAPPMVERLGRDLVLSWFDGPTTHEHTLTDEAAAVLLQSGLPFVATAEAWTVLADLGVGVAQVGVAQVNLDGFIEISATVPQLVESAPLPGLFRLGTDRFGLALGYAPNLDSTPGFSWRGPRPRPERPEIGVSTTFDLSAHHRRDLTSVADRLADTGAAVLWWDSGLGRRIMALAALDALDAWPAVVVSHPSGLWAWQRHFELVGRSCALTHDRADARLVTYRDLAHGMTLPSPAALILDEPTRSEAVRPEVLRSLHQLDGVAGTVRLATTDTWPERPEDTMGLMSVLRPGEFDPAATLAERYPLDPQRRAGEHLAAYVSRRRASDPDSVNLDRFRRSSVHTVPVSEAHTREAVEVLRRRGADREGALAELLELCSAGSAHSVSPKTAAAAELAGRSSGLVVVACRHVRTASLLKMMLAGREVSVVEADRGGLDSGDGSGRDRVVVVRFDRTLPDLRSADAVIFVDYPWSTTVVDDAVGSAAETDGPAQVTVIHLEGSLDDRLAAMAARRRELRGVRDENGPPTSDELDYLLAPRW